jgi:hypothetical protein
MLSLIGFDFRLVLANEKMLEPAILTKLSSVVVKGDFVEDEYSHQRDCRDLYHHTDVRQARGCEMQAHAELRQGRDEQTEDEFQELRALHSEGTRRIANKQGREMSAADQSTLEFLRVRGQSVIVRSGN